MVVLVVFLPSFELKLPHPPFDFVTKGEEECGIRTD